jgi:hypothetical protein
MRGFVDSTWEQPKKKAAGVRPFISTFMTGPQRFSGIFHIATKSFEERRANQFESLSMAIARIGNGSISDVGSWII